MKAALLVMLFLPAVLYSNRAGAQMQYDYKVDGAVTLALLGTSGMFELFKEETTSEECRWCAQNSFDNAIRSSLVWKNTGDAILFSNIAIAAVPIVGFIPHLLLGKEPAGSRPALARMLRVSLITIEAVSLSLVAGQVVKRIAARERPYVRTLPINEQGTDPDHNVSFFSGHSSLAFTVGISLAASLYLEGMADHLWYLLLNGVLAGTVAYLRIAGDKHYFTDVLVGALIGTTIGLVVPWLHKKKSPASSTATAYVAPSPGGAVVGFALRF